MVLSRKRITRSEHSDLPGDRTHALRRANPRPEQEMGHSQMIDLDALVTEIGNGFEDAAPNALSSNRREEAFDHPLSMALGLSAFTSATAQPRLLSRASKTKFISSSTRLVIPNANGGYHAGIELADSEDNRNAYVLIANLVEEFDSRIELGSASHI